MDSGVSSVSDIFSENDLSSSLLQTLYDINDVWDDIGYSSHAKEEEKSKVLDILKVCNPFLIIIQCYLYLVMKFID